MENQIPVACPFCGNKPQHHEGNDYVLGHANSCFFTQQYAQEMWLIGNRRIAQWNVRAGGHEPAMSETGGTKGVGISDLLERSVAIVQAIDALRENEGAMVTICCDNPDYNGLPNCAIDVCDGWTDWEEESFRADTVLDCLQLALKSRTERVKRSNVELSDGRGGH